jgi:hypothetical protein
MPLRPRMSGDMPPACLSTEGNTGMAIAQAAVIPYLSAPVLLLGQVGEEKCSIIKHVGP